MNANELVTCVRFAPQSDKENFTLMCTSNLQGLVKLYKYDTYQDLVDGKVDTPILEFKDHFFPVNDIAFCPHARTM